MKEESESYAKINGELFLYKDILREIEEKLLELTKKLYKDEISAKNYKEELSNHMKVIEKASKFVDTKKEFFNEYLKWGISSKVAKEFWKHEREHLFIAKQNGLISQIGIVRSISRELPIKGELLVGLKPFVHCNLLDFIEKWPLDKIKQSSLSLLGVTKLSESDKKQMDLIKSIK